MDKELPVAAMPVIHNKTSNLYFLLQNIINATNEQDGQKMCLYVNTKGQMFVRESEEFYAKFTPVQVLINDSVNELNQLKEDSDIESAHCLADNVLCQLLDKLGYGKVVDAYSAIDKWYA